MSGIEVTGLVLGAFPLLVSGLEHYAEGLETIGRWWRYKRSSAHLAGILDAEWGRFQGTCEKLLDGLVSGAELDSLVEDPGGPLWKNKDLDKKLKRRLGRDYHRYFRCVRAMDEAVNDLWSRLELDECGRPQWGSYYSFKHHYKRIRASLSHRKYEAALSKITRNNDILASLTEQNVQAEPSRRRRRKSRAELQDLQHQARCLYDSLDMQCNCDYYHRTELRLNTRLNSEDQDQLSNLRFGYRIYIDDQSDDPLWYEFIARILETKPAKQLLSQKPSGADKTEKVSSVGDKFLSILAGKPTSKDVKERKKKGVKFSGLSDPGDVSRRLGRELVKGSSMAFDNSSTIKIDYLCNEAQKLALTMSTGQSKGATKGLLGVLHRTASSRATVGIFIAPESHRDRRKATSLSRLLSGKTRDKKARLRLTLGNLTLGQGERLILALTLASNSLQLHGTRWLDDLRDKSSIMLDLGCVDDRTGAPEVYISKAFPDEDPKTQSQQSLMPFVILNPIIYNLGILLIEIYLGQTLESLRTEEDPLDHNGQANILTDLSTAMRLVDNIYSLAGTGYGDAVRRCLRGDFDSRCTDLNDESFRQAVYEKVVEPLEEDVKNFYRLGQESV